MIDPHHIWNVDIDRFRNYPGFRNYDSETEIQKLFRPIQKLRFRNYSRRIQKLFSTDSETISPDSETIFDRFRNYFRPIQKLRSRNYFRRIQKLFSKDSETIYFDRFRNYFRPIQKLRFRNYFRPIQKLRFRNYFRRIQKIFFDRFRHYDWHPMLSSILFLSILRPPSPSSWQPRLSMISPPLAFLATHAFNDFFKSIFSAPPPSWQPMLSMIFLLSKISPPPCLGNPCFQCFKWFSFYQIFFHWNSSCQPMLFFPPSTRLLGNPCFQWLCF